jgi:hypothetical protein
MSDYSKNIYPAALKAERERRGLGAGGTSPVIQEVYYPSYILTRMMSGLQQRQKPPGFGLSWDDLVSEYGRERMRIRARQEENRPDFLYKEGRKGDSTYRCKKGQPRRCENRCRGSLYATKNPM